VVGLWRELRARKARPYGKIPAKMLNAPVGARFPRPQSPTSPTNSRIPKNHSIDDDSSSDRPAPGFNKKYPINAAIGTTPDNPNCNPGLRFNVEKKLKYAIPPQPHIINCPIDLGDLSGDLSGDLTLANFMMIHPKGIVQ
jgi:hypothetical protein